MPSRAPIFPAAIVLAVLAGCVPRAAPPPAVPAPRVPLPRPTPMAAPPPSIDWRDWPVTQGDWRYSGAAGGSIASFGAPGAAPLLSLRCEAATRTVEIARSGGAPAAAMQVRTTSTSRTLPAMAGAGGGARARLPANDPLLDAMGFSRGKFVVGGAGSPPLVLPAWAEVLRVIEDCRG